MNKYIGKRKILIYVPKNILRLIFKLIGLDSFSAKLLDDLTINCSLAENLLGWERKHKIESGIKEMLC